MNERHCFFKVSIAGSKPQKVVFELDTKTCPKTSHNFQSFCTCTDAQKSYRKSIFHRVIPDFMVQGGDYENFDGTGGQAFEGGTLQDESFANAHDRSGILSMANKGKNTAGSQFFITLGRASHLDGKHVAFGRVVEGMDVVMEMGKVETDEKDKPVAMQKIVIVDCGKGDGIDEKKDIDSDSAISSSKERKTSSRKRSKSSRHDERKSKKRRKERRDYDSDYSSSCRSRRRKKKSSKKHKKEKYSSDEDSSFSSEDGSYRDRKRSKKRKKHSSRKDRDKKKRSRAYSSDESSLSDRDRKNDKKHKKSSKRKSSDRRKSKIGDKTVDQGGSNAFGKFGIVKESDFHSSTKIKRSFEVWLAEVKGIPQGSNMVSSYVMKISYIEVCSFSLKKYLIISFNLTKAKWETTEYFKEFAEDFNTATMPHEKFYDYDKWEMEEYNRRKNHANSKKGAVSDEFKHLEEIRQKAIEKQRQDLDMIKSGMSRDKILDMKNQARMKAEMVCAYRMGDDQKRKRLQRRLEPDEK